MDKEQPKTMSTIARLQQEWIDQTRFTPILEDCDDCTTELRAVMVETTAGGYIHSGAAMSIFDCMMMEAQEATGLAVEMAEKGKELLQEVETLKAQYLDLLHTAENKKSGRNPNGPS